MSTSSARDGAAQRNEQLLMELLREEANRHCADCGQKGTRWASWNLGVFLCIRCGGLHRKLGTHISKVKSVNLDKWTEEQVEHMRANGNAKANATYNPHPERFPFPAYSGDMEQYIRDKYERRLFAGGDVRGARPPAVAAPRSEHSARSADMLALRDMGFADVAANGAALRAAGSLQAAVEALLASAGGAPPADAPRRHTDYISGDHRDDLASIFGGPSVEAARVPDGAPGGERDAHCEREDPEGFAAFETATSPRSVPAPAPADFRHADFPAAAFADAPAPPALSNPWAVPAIGAAAHATASDDPFGEIDPFRNFTPSREH